MRAPDGVQDITSRNFSRYGRIIEYPGAEKKGTKRNLWRIVHRSTEKTGWRIAYLGLRDKTVRRLECHPGSDETFEPVKGRSVIWVSAQKVPTKLKAFWLDKPIILYKGVWHGVVAVGREAHFKICENEWVECRYFPLKERISLHNPRRKK